MKTKTGIFVNKSNVKTILNRYVNFKFDICLNRFCCYQNQTKYDVKFHQIESVEEHYK